MSQIISTWEDLSACVNSPQISVSHAGYDGYRALTYVKEKNGSKKIAWRLVLLRMSNIFLTEKGIVTYLKGRIIRRNY